MTATGWERLDVGGTEQKGKRTQGCGQQCGDWRGDRRRYKRGLNSNGKNTIFF